MSLLAHITAQRTDHCVPHAAACRALGVAESTFYARRSRKPSQAQQRRGLRWPYKAARPVPDLVRRDFTAAEVNQKWVGD